VKPPGDAAARREGARPSRAVLGDRYRAWLQHHRLSAADSLRRILESPGGSLLTALVIGVALALPVGLQLALDNLGSITSGWQSGTEISLFLDRSLPADDARVLEVELRARAEVADVRFVARDEALAEFGRTSGFADVLASLNDNPLPDLVVVTPGPGLDNDAVAQLSEDLQALPPVEEAVLDMAWLQRLQGLMELGRRLALALGAVLVLAVVLILGNTIRLAIESRREEIVVVKLVGGSNAFVRRPFLYTGLWYGVGGGAAAALLVSVARWYLQEPVARLAALYGSPFELAGLDVMGALNLVLLGGLLGLAGAWLAVARHLAEIEPR